MPRRDDPSARPPCPSARRPCRGRPQRPPPSGRSHLSKERFMKSQSTILLCEEHAATRAFLADNLTADGFEVFVANDKASALKALEAREPDLVVCDVNGDTL